MPFVSAASSASDSISRFTRWLFFVVLLFALLGYAIQAWHWPLIQDSAVMHYVVFLLRHGFRPYRDITDNNLPGSYLLERAAMTVFGGGDLGWRLYDYALLAALTAALSVIAWPHDRLAGLYAGGLFALQHGNDGLWFAAEREQEVTVLLALACASLFLAVRRRVPVAVASFGFLAGMASSIKPTFAPFGLLSLALLWYFLKRQKIPAGRYLVSGIAGLLAATFLSLGFLFHYGSFHDFLFVLRTVTPVYAGLDNPTRRYLVLQAVPFILWPLFAFGAVALLLRRRRPWDVERATLWLAVFCGLFSYFAQGKGFPYHRYLYLAFALVLVGIETLPRATPPRVLQWAGAVSLLYAALVVIPWELHGIRTAPTTDPMSVSMEADLRELAGSQNPVQQLDGKVQCFDMILGCLDSLYHLGLLENTGFTGDMLLFARHANPATAYYQHLFAQSQAKDPASVLIVTNEDFGEPNSFDRLSRWPAFEERLGREYVLVATRTFPRQGKRSNEPDEPLKTALAYRIYLRRCQVFPPLRDREESSSQ